MNSKPKKEQVFVLLLLFIACFFLTATTGASGAPVPNHDENSSHLSDISCMGCEMIYGKVGDIPFWSCGKATGCVRGVAGCVEEDGQVGAQLGFSYGCGSCREGFLFDHSPKGDWNVQFFGCSYNSR